MFSNNFRTNLIILGSAIGAVSDIAAAIIDSSENNPAELMSLSSMLSTLLMAGAGGFIPYIFLKIYDQHRHRLFSNRRETETPTFDGMITSFNANNGDDMDRSPSPAA